MGEEVGYGVVTGVSEAVNDEFGFRDKFGKGEICGHWRERRASG